ncbi:hypothetical protein [Raoultella ornithinolytica]|uniref:Uncharacterized protein n=1 Tax=Raoultella ornithinolytica TaxID=54291 RepID=A0A9Q9JCW9_RAOOR|nr:hypothetical protein [Raoultella ornithinolytica]UXE36448.1 hypothetical protein N2J37_18025 [Raoultella ornithinolytica]
MWLMKTLLTSGCTNQRGAGQGYDPAIVMEEIEKERNMDKEQNIDGTEQESEEGDQLSTD